MSWQSLGVLKKWLLKAIEFQKKSKEHSVVNPHLKEKVFQWARGRSKNVNDKFTPAHMWKEMGKICKWRPWRIKVPPPPTGHSSRRNLVLSICWCAQLHLRFAASCFHFHGRTMPLLKSTCNATRNKFHKFLAHHAIQPKNKQKKSVNDTENYGLEIL